MGDSNIGGCTLHSWAGIGLGQLEEKILLANVRRNNITKARWQTTDALVIDESEFTPSQIKRNANEGSLHD